MDEEFKAIIELLAQTGEATANLFVFYVVASWLQNIIICGGFFWLVVYAMRLLNQHCSASSVLEDLRDIAGVGCPGPITNSEIGKLREFIVRARNERRAA